MALLLKGTGESVRAEGDSKHHMRKNEERRFFFSPEASSSETGPLIFFFLEVPPSRIGAMTQ